MKHEQLKQQLKEKIRVIDAIQAFQKQIDNLEESNRGFSQHFPDLIAKNIANIEIKQRAINRLEQYL